jgi:hypothetical protein
MGTPSTSRHQSDDPADDPVDSIYGLPTGANRSLGDLISPDDWRLYHLMRELPEADRARIIAFAELLFNLREGRRWAEGGGRRAEGG